MLGARLPLLLLPLYHSLTPTAALDLDEAMCYINIYQLPKFYRPQRYDGPQYDSRIPLASDCRAAIDIMPSGAYIFDGQNLEKPRHFYRPPQHRDWLFVMPALFHSGTCMVRVEARPAPSHALPTATTARHNNIRPDVRRAPSQAATAMYNII